jgi:DNA-directed RNA polymerase beta subunit
VLQLLLRHLTANQSNPSIVIRIRIGGLRVPQMGDKFASRHGQKGTIGAILPVEDMPYVGNGVLPDLLFNSHGIPSRMTIGQLWEVVLSKFNLCDTNAFHGRCFDPGNTRALYKAFKLSDSEPLYSGITGELLGCCSTGVAYYQRLKHMTRDKMHARALGPVTQMVRQPTDGRARAGGLRIGEMERDALIAHGCISFLNERLLWKSDAYRIVICGTCGSYPATQTMWLGTTDQSVIGSCTGCKGAGHQTSAVVPYSFKLLLQEAASTGIAIYLQSDPRLKQ